MSNKFAQMRKEMLQTLAKNNISPINEEDLDGLIQKYGESELIKSIKYLIARGMVNPDAICTTNVGDSIDSESLALTANGFDIATDDELGYKISSVPITIHSSTLNSLADIIKASNLKTEEKKTLLSKLKEEGEKQFMSRCIDLGFSCAPVATTILLNFLQNMPK